MNEPALTEAVKTDCPSSKPNRHKRLSLRLVGVARRIALAVVVAEEQKHAESEGKAMKFRHLILYLFIFFGFWAVFIIVSYIILLFRYGLVM
jgi:hypothetical protein